MANMHDPELRKMLAETIAKTAAQRDLLAWLLAYVAKQESDSESVFQRLSAESDDRLQRAPADNAGLLPLLETMRAEFDWIILEARDILRNKIR